MKRPWSPRRPGPPTRLHWGSLALSLVAGVAAALAHPPFGFLPGLLGYALLLALLDRAAPARPLRSAALRGWVAGLGYFAVSLWWVAEAFFVDAAAHAWMAPIVMLILPGGMALFWAGAAALFRAMAPGRGDWSPLRRVLLFAALVGVFEWLRGHVLTGFPWNLPGETWRAGSAPSQAAALIGAYGLSILTVALAATPAAWLTEAPRRVKVAAGALSVALLAGLYGYGAWRLAQPTPPAQPTRVRVVQANIDQKEKWRPENLDQILGDYLALTRSPGRDDVDLVIWPEGAIPSAANDYLGADVARRRQVASVLRPGQTLLTGAFRVDLDPRTGDQRAFNTLVALRQTGEDLALTAVYDKHRLVPLGEFLPLRPILEPIGFASLVHAPADFTPGPRPAPIQGPGLPRVQPLICYESLFPGLARTDGPRPSWIANVSNDSWFGRTSGPWQHLNIASYRAIEAGLPMIRSTPTGISAVIDGKGRALRTILPGQAGVLDTALPAPLTRTLYARIGDATFWILFVLGLCVAAPARVRWKKA